MNASARLFCVVAVAAVSGAALTAASHPVTAQANRGSSFPCSWRWNLVDGLRAGYVTAGNSANCGGRLGSLTLTVRLMTWNAKTKRWHTDKAQSRTWTDLRVQRYVEVARRCSISTVRAVFGWILRDTRRTVVSSHLLTTAPLHVPSPSCQVTLSGPGTPPRR